MTSRTRQRGRLLAVTALADETGDARRVAHAVPRLVVHDATNQQIAREDLALHGLLLAVLELVDLLHGDDDLVDLVLHVHRLDARLEVGRDLLLVARLRVHHVPLARTHRRVVENAFRNTVGFVVRFACSSRLVRLVACACLVGCAHVGVVGVCLSGRFQISVTRLSEFFGVIVVGQDVGGADGEEVGGGGRRLGDDLVGGGGGFVGHVSGLSQIVGHVGVSSSRTTRTACRTSSRSHRRARCTPRR